MERQKLNQDVDLDLLEGHGPEPRTTPSEEPSCDWCGRPLTGRREHFCSDRCRMRNVRHVQRLKRLGLLDTIEAAVQDLRNELEPQ